MVLGLHHNSESWRYLGHDDNPENRSTLSMSVPVPELLTSPTMPTNEARLSRNPGQKGRCNRRRLYSEPGDTFGRFGADVHIICEACPLAWVW